MRGPCTWRKATLSSRSRSEAAASLSFDARCSLNVLRQSDKSEGQISNLVCHFTDWCMSWMTLNAFWWVKQLTADSWPTVLWKTLWREASIPAGPAFPAHINQLISRLLVNHDHVCLPLSNFSQIPRAIICLGSARQEWARKSRFRRRHSLALLIPSTKITLGWDCSQDMRLIWANWNISTSIGPRGITLLLPSLFIHFPPLSKQESLRPSVPPSFESSLS